MIRRAIALIALVSACTQADTPHIHSDKSSVRPQRIVSLDLCADQYVLKFAEPERILALSPEAELDISYLRDAASGIRQVRPLPENILIMKPDLIVRAYGGGPNATRFFEEAGIPVLNIGWASDVDGIKQVVRDMADGLGAHQAGLDTVADMELRLSQIARQDRETSVLYMTASGYTTGPETLIDDFFRHAGLSNYLSTPGWHALPLEQLASAQPDIIALAYPENLGNMTDTWSATRNPIARTLLKDKPVIPLDGAVMSCSGWYVVDAIEALAKGATS